MSSVLLMVLIYNIIVIGGIGWYLNQKDKASGRVTDMAQGGADATIAMFSVTLAITYLGSAHVYGLMEMSFGMGAVALWFCFAHTILMCVICLGTGRWVRRLGCATIPQLQGELFGKQMRNLTACVGGMVVFGLVCLETQAIGIALSATSGWSLPVSVVVGAVIGLAYVTMGGIKQTMWVNLVNAVVMYGSIIIAGFYLAFALPEGWDGVQQFYVDNGQEFKLSIFGTPDLLFGFGVATVFSVVFSQSVNQQGMAAAMSAKDEKVIRRSLWIAAPINGLFGVFPVLVGLAAATIPEFAELGPKLAGATLVVKLLPTWLVVLLQAGFLGALLSTYAMTVLAPATIFTKDIIQANQKKKMTAVEEKKTMQRFILIFGGVGAVLTFFNQPAIVPAINWLFAWLAPLFFVTVAGLFWKRNANVAAATLLISWACNLAWTIRPIKEAIISVIPAAAPLENAHITAVVALVLTVVLLAFTKNAEPAKLARNEHVLVRGEG
ncbi:sodium:solute symporter family protein [Vibrio algarum]|uniref:Sodium:solute symporter family protein n=1 Tax=Vibrio algarum TaxID=3020714 RepID=A0ABT4YUM7_9VIBR|nr:sodium:solute symporter family protein [Vibrio sp. KJ40-1]MDB1125287.1 sodium:solute symporter family protein [Vibrio sp. KJ40-1]